MQIVMDQVFTVPAHDLVNSNVVYAGDGDMIEHQREFCYTEQLIECLMYKYEKCSPHFIQSIVNINVKNPLRIEPSSVPEVYQIINGHHRLAVAYLHNLKVPVFFDSDDNWFKVPQKRLMFHEGWGVA